MLIDDIKKDLQQARIMRDEGWASALRTLLGDLQKAEKDGQELSDSYVVKVLKKYVKNADECIENLEEGDSRRSGYYRDIAIYQKFVPKQLTAKDIVSILRREFLDNGEAVQIGPAMKFLKQNYGDQVDGKIASKAIKGMMG